MEAILKIAKALRRKMLAEYGESLGLCRDYSKLLKPRLEKVGFKVNLVEGVFQCSSTTPYDGYGLTLAGVAAPPHCWLSLVEEKPFGERIVVDVTADQFRPWHRRYIPAVLIARYGEWPEYIVGAE